MKNELNNNVKLLSLSEVRDLVDGLTIFYDTFNERPISHTTNIPRLYYSEKLINSLQLENYEQQCKYLKKLLASFIAESNTRNDSPGDDKTTL